MRRFRDFLLVLAIASPALARSASAQSSPVQPSPVQSSPGQPPPVQTPTEGRAALLDRLFATLKNAQSEEDAVALEAQIRAVWANQASPAVALLMQRGARDLAAGSFREAEADYDAAVTLAPDYAEAWRLRGVARFRLGENAAAIADMAEALKRDPRHFLALRNLSEIAEAQGDWKSALAAWERLLAIDPHTEGAGARLRDLRQHALGQSI
jgi:tetratricopeptide (TPR) repeat protein